MSLFIAVASALAVFVTCNGYSTSCVTGECKSIYDCETVRDIMVKKFKSAEEREFLTKSICGFINVVPKICCPLTNVLLDNPDLLQSKSGSIISTPIEVSTQKPITSTVRPDANQCKKKVSAFAPDPSSNCCGIESTMDDKIIGGNKTAIDQYPWLALIEYAKVRTVRCAGALISGRYVLTAAHCVIENRYGKPVSVVLGEYDISHEGPDCIHNDYGEEDCTDGALRIRIGRVIPHPSYDPFDSMKRNDIGLIRLRKMSPYTFFIRPVCLPTKDVTLSPPSNLTFYVAGFGATASNSKSTVKSHVALPFVNLTKCQSEYSVPGYRKELWQNQLCAGGESGKDSCTGDSGGPLMYENMRTQEIVGVVSYGPIYCATESMPGIYTKVIEYKSWILLNMRP